MVSLRYWLRRRAACHHGCCRFLAELLLVLAAAGWAGFAMAASDAFCRRYASDAVIQQADNVANRFDGGSLELVGDAWSFNKNHHDQWCLGVTEATANRERNFRASELQRGFNCKLYAAGAQVAQMTNPQNNCGFAGNAWSTDYRNHYLWCRGPHRPGDIGREEGLRRDALDRCATPSPPPGAAAVCQEYANAAIQAQSENERAQCGLIGDAWSYNHAGHKQWCLGVDQASRDREAANRTNALRACGGCHEYAREALSQYVLNVQNNCGFAGNAWSGNRAGHQSWCLAQGGNGAPQRERDLRASLLRQCGVR